MLYTHNMMISAWQTNVIRTANVYGVVHNTTRYTAIQHDATHTAIHHALLCYNSSAMQCTAAPSTVLVAGVEPALAA